jgi:hypothetical protein
MEGETRKSLQWHRVLRDMLRDFSVERTAA